MVTPEVQSSEVKCQNCEDDACALINLFDAEFYVCFKCAEGYVTPGGGFCIQESTCTDAGLVVSTT